MRLSDRLVARAGHDRQNKRVCVCVLVANFWSKVLVLVAYFLFAGASQIVFRRVDISLTMPKRAAADVAQLSKLKRAKTVTTLATGASTNDSADAVLLVPDDEAVSVHGTVDEGSVSGASLRTTTVISINTGLFEFPTRKIEIPAFKYSTRHSPAELEQLLPDYYWQTDSQHDVLCRCECCQLVWELDDLN